MSEKTPTPFVKYYYGRLSTAHRKMLILETGLSRSAFYLKMNNPGKLTTTEASAICAFVANHFEHKWPIDAVMYYVDGTNQLHNKPKLTTKIPTHVH